MLVVVFVVVVGGVILCTYQLSLGFYIFSRRLLYLLISSYFVSYGKGGDLKKGII